MTTMLLYNPNHKPPGAGGGQFAPKGGGGSGGSGRVSAARMARIEQVTSEAEVKGGGMTAITRQCAACGKMLNGPKVGQKLPLPHSASWGHALCPTCAHNEVRVLRAERAGTPLTKTLQRFVARKHAIKQDYERRVAQYIADHPTTQADEGVRGMRLADIWSRPLRLDEGADGQCRSWIMLMPQGEYEHPEYGKLHFTRKKLAEFKANFDEGVRKIDIALDADHKATQGDSRATGWIESMELREPMGEMPGGLWACIAWTSYGAQLLHDKIYRYFSPEFGDYTDEATGTVHHNVIIGGALTNRPFLKVMPSLALAEVSNRPWGSVNKSALPKSCFLWVAGPNKSDWHLPVYESNGQGGRGPLNINGVKAAFGALHGARSGHAMSVPASVRARIISLHNKYFGASADRQAHEGMKGGTMTYQFAAKTPLKAKAGGPTPSGSNDVADYDPGDDEDPTQFDDGEEDASLDDAEEAESYDDTEDDAAMDDGDSDADDGFGGKKAPPFGKGKQMSRKASAKTSSRSGGRKMSEATMTRQMAELQRQMAERDQQLAELQYRDYTRGVDDVLRSWSSGQTMTFFAAETASLPKGKVSAIGGKRVERKRTVALTAEAERRIRAFLLDEGYQLSERRRTKVLDLIQFLLSERAQVDLTRYGSSFDQEARKTISVASRQRDTFEGADLDEVARGLAAQAGKDFTALSLDEKLRYYTLAEQEA